MATRWQDVFDAIESAGGAEAFAGKTVIDINNPVDIESFLTTRPDGRSLTEAIADALPDARVGKAFNMAQVAVWADPDMTYDGRSGFADGIRCDEDGNVWSSAGWVGDGFDGVHIFAPDGDRIGQIILPAICSNVCFGGTKRNRLFMTGSTSLYAVYVETKGAHIA